MQASPDQQPVILCIGPSHKTASLAARERFALVGRAAQELPGELLAHPDVLEVVPLATCNRSELYLVVTDPAQALPVAMSAFARLAEADPEELATMLAVREEQAAVRHLFRVASGAESVVLGEAQIQGQIKQALTRAGEEGWCGPLLDRLFRHALEVGKRTRSETLLGAGHASIGSVAAELISDALGTLDGRTVLLLGAGEMSALAARNVAGRGTCRVLVTSRTGAHAHALASSIGGETVPFDEVDSELERCDVVICSTSAPHVILTRERIEHAIARREARPLVLVDLAVPRDVDPEVGELAGCHLYDLDDLERLVASTADVRAAELAGVDDIVSGEAARFSTWRRSLDVVPSIRLLRERGERIRERELQRFDGKFAHLAPEDRRRIEQLTRSLVNKLLHEPTARLRESAGEDERSGQHAAYTVALHELFGLQSAE